MSVYERALIGLACIAVLVIAGLQIGPRVSAHMAKAKWDEEAPMRMVLKAEADTKAAQEHERRLAKTRSVP